MAPLSVTNFFQYSIANSQFFPWAQKVVHKDNQKFCYQGNKPAFAPASIDILHKVILSSIVISNIVEPENSITCPVPAAVPISLITFKIISLDVTFFLSFPLILFSYSLA